MPRVVRRLATSALLFAAAAAHAAAPDAPPGSPAPGLEAPDDSTEAAADGPLAWARAAVRARAAVEAAEAEVDPEAQRGLALEALRAVEALATSPASAASTRPLALRAQAAVERHHGAVASGPLAHDEVAALRGPALAALGPAFAPPLESPAALAARRAEAARRAAAVEAAARRAEGPAWLDYPLEAAGHVEAQRAAAARLARAGRRNPRTLRHIERTFRRRGLPADLRYVAVIESALDPNAESWAGAEGLWQFMPETAAEYGLDSLSVRELGPSTDAAARYLRWLGRRFSGDWHLALAAYNCGVGRVEGVVREVRAEIGRTPTFWDIRERLPRETQHYVPRFLAVAEALGARG